MKGSNLTSFSRLLYILIVMFIRCHGALYTRDPNFDDMNKSGFETQVYKATSHGQCGLYAVVWGSQSFFFNQLTYECQLVYGVHNDVTGANPHPGNSYFIVEVPESEASGGCSPADLSDGFIDDSATGLCFKIFETSSNWGAAKAHCESQGYKLVVLDTVAKAQFVSDLIQTHAGFAKDGYWIGLSQTTGWVDNSALISVYWGTSGETLDNGMCVRLDRSKGYKWVEDHCNSSRGHICQRVA